MSAPVLICVWLDVRTPSTATGIRFVKCVVVAVDADLHDKTIPYAESATLRINRAMFDFDATGHYACQCFRPAVERQAKPVMKEI